MPAVRNSTQTKKRPRVKDAKRIYTITDPLQKMTAKRTELRGRIEPSRATGYFETADPALAKEIKARYPHMLVTEHEKQGGRENSFSSFGVDGLRRRPFTDEEMIADGWVRDGARWVKRLKQ